MAANSASAVPSSCAASLIAAAMTLELAPCDPPTLIAMRALDGLAAVLAGGDPASPARRVTAGMALQSTAADCARKLRRVMFMSESAGGVSDRALDGCPQALTAVRQMQSHSRARCFGI